MAHHQNIAEWHGKTLVDRDGQKIGRLQDVYVDVETDEPMFGTVKEGLIGRTGPSCRWPGSRSARTPCKWQ
jgi:sporulation protein YlmC with PRC-barrel domain